MTYLKFDPCSSLLPFVECYFIWESGDEPVHDLVVESPPSGFCSIVFNCGDGYHLQNKKYERLQVPGQFVSGQSIYSYKLFLNGNISLAGIVFKPAGLATLFDLPVYEYTEERIDLNLVFKPAIVANTMSQLKSLKEPKEKAKVLETFLLEQYHHHKPHPDFIDEGANLIVKKNGILNVNELLENIYMSRRNFERRFFKKVGLSPKYYARIRRMSYLMLLITGRKKVDWADVLNECGFYDQSHFIKDFMEFTGRTPQQYLEENQELIHHVTRPKQQPLS